MTNKQFERYCVRRVFAVKGYNGTIYAIEPLQHDLWLERMGLIETAFVKDIYLHDG